MKIIPATFAILVGLGSTCASAQSLIAGWNMSTVAAGTTANTFAANFSDMYPGDGVANDGAAGTLFANGLFGSSIISNTGSFTLLSDGGDSSFNSDVVTDSRPLGNDLNVLGLPGDPVFGNQRLAIADGSFGGGGPQDPSGDFLVFAAFAPQGMVFDAGTYTLSYSVGNNGMDGNVLNWATSNNGGFYTNAGSYAIGSLDEIGTSISLTASGVETGLYFRMQVPQVGFGSLLIDNVQIIGGSTVEVPEPSTVALMMGFAALGFVLYRRRSK